MRYESTSRMNPQGDLEGVVEACSDPHWTTIAEFVMRWVVALGGWGVAFFLWKLRRDQAKRIADHVEVNKAIDSALEQIEKFETSVLEFWSDPQSKILSEQLASHMAACAFYSSQIKNLCLVREYPSKELLDVRRTATMNMEQESRGLDSQKNRLGRFVKLVAKLRKADIYQKRPFTG